MKVLLVVVIMMAGDLVMGRPGGEKPTGFVDYTESQWIGPSPVKGPDGLSEITVPSNPPPFSEPNGPSLSYGPGVPIQPKGPDGTSQDEELGRSSLYSGPATSFPIWPTQPPAKDLGGPFLNEQLGETSSYYGPRALNPYYGPGVQSLSYGSGRSFPKFFEPKGLSQPKRPIGSSTAEDLGGASPFYGPGGLTPYYGPGGQYISYGYGSGRSFPIFFEPNGLSQPKRPFGSSLAEELGAPSPDEELDEASPFYGPGELTPYYGADGKSLSYGSGRSFPIFFEPKTPSHPKGPGFPSPAVELGGTSPPYVLRGLPFIF